LGHEGGKWHGDYIYNFATRQGKSPTTNVGTRDRKVEAQGGDSEYCALVGWSYVREGQNLGNV